MTTIRKRTATAALAVAAIGGTIVAITASAAPASTGTTISFTEHNISDQTFNLGSGHGFTVGYVELVANKLMQGGKQAGHDGQSYTVTRLGNGSADELVSSAEVLAHGQIDLSGLVTSTPPVPAPSSLRSPEAPETTSTPGATPPSCQVTPRRSPSISPRDRQPNGPRPARPGRASPTKLTRTRRRAMDAEIL